MKNATDSKVARAGGRTVGESRLLEASSRTRGTRGLRAAWMALGLIGVSGVLVTVDGPCGIRGAAGESSGETVPPEQIIILQGPNDGEPINARTIRLKLVTNHDGYGTIRVQANGAYLHSRSLQTGAWTEPSGLLATWITVDVEEVARRTGVDMTSFEGHPLGVTVSLYSSTTLRLISFADWRGYVSSPRLELSAMADPTDPVGEVPVILHPLRADRYYMLLTSRDAASLTRSPEDPRLLSVADIAAAGVCDTTASRLRGREVIVDGPSHPTEPEIFVVLWTYDPDRGWKRSQICPLPR